MKIALLTLCIGEDYKNAVKYGIQSKKEYCKKHNYDFIIGDKNIYDVTRPIAWSKIKMIKKYLKNYDYIFCSDADVILMNYDIKIEDLIKMYFKENTNILLTKDWQNLNTGNMIIKNDSKIFEFLDDIYKQIQFLNHSWWEQAAFIHLYDNNKNIRDFCVVLEKSHVLNAYIFEFEKYPIPDSNKFRNDDFLIHFAGISSLRTLHDIMKICYEKKLFLFDKINIIGTNWTILK